jgi:lipopolysaccharide heptosyltransferase II
MSIAVFLPNWVGDAVMATPAVRALREHYRDARLVAVVRPYVAGVFGGCDWFNDVVYLRGKSWQDGTASAAFKLRKIGVDLAVLFPNSFRSALTAWLGGCTRRIGYARYGRSAMLTDALPPVRDAAGRRTPSPALDAYNLLAVRAGCPDPGRRMTLFTTPADEADAAVVWKNAGLSRYREVICLNPGAAFGSAKHWPSEYFASLARDLAEKRGAGVLVLCGPAERPLSQEIAARARHPAVHALGDQATPVRPDGPPLSLGLTKACVRRAALLVTTDSGPRHFAAAFDRPVVTLFGPTHIAWTETYHPRAVHLQRQVECGPCQRRVCPLDHRCMKQLLPAEAFAAAEGLLRLGKSA